MLRDSYHQCTMFNFKTLQQDIFVITSFSAYVLLLLLLLLLLLAYIDYCTMHHDINMVQNCCSVNGMKLNLGKSTNIFSIVKKLRLLILNINYVTHLYHAPSMLKISVYS
jgi:hypothetical protein